MILPIRTDSPLRRTPWMNWALIVITVCIFLGQTALGEEAWRGLMLHPRDPQVLHYVTYALLHANWMHLLGNMVFLYIFGNNVCDKMGNLGYLGFYLGGAVFAGIGYVITQGDPIPVLGASGAVAAVTGAYLVLFPRSHITVLFFFFIITFFQIPSMWFIAFFFLKDLVMNFAGTTGVAHTAHIGGTVFGFSVCMVLLAAKLLPRDQFDLFALLQRWNKRRQYQAMVRQGYDPFGPSASLRADPEPPQLDPRAEKIQDLRAEISESIAHHNLPHAAARFLELKTLDPQQVLSRQAQLDVANQLASEHRYPQAAEAYEQFLKHYSSGDLQQVGHVQLMLGLVYARYLRRYDKAHEHLSGALERIHGERERELARVELARVEPLVQQAEQT